MSIFERDVTNSGVSTAPNQATSDGVLDLHRSLEYNTVAPNQVAVMALDSRPSSSEAGETLSNVHTQVCVGSTRCTLGPSSANIGAFSSNGTSLEGSLVSAIATEQSAIGNASRAVIAACTSCSNVASEAVPSLGTAMVAASGCSIGENMEVKYSSIVSSRDSAFSQEGSGAVSYSGVCNSDQIALGSSEFVSVLSSFDCNGSAAASSAVLASSACGWRDVSAVSLASCNGTTVRKASNCCYSAVDSSSIRYGKFCDIDSSRSASMSSQDLVSGYSSIKSSAACSLNTALSGADILPYSYCTIVACNSCTALGSTNTAIVAATGSSVSRSQGAGVYCSSSSSVTTSDYCAIVASSAGTSVGGSAGSSAVVASVGATLSSGSIATSLVSCVNSKCMLANGPVVMLNCSDSLVKATGGAASSQALISFSGNYDNGQGYSNVTVLSSSVQAGATLQPRASNTVIGGSARINGGPMRWEINSDLGTITAEGAISQNTPLPGLQEVLENQVPGVIPPGRLLRLCAGSKVRLCRPGEKGHFVSRLFEASSFVGGDSSFRWQKASLMSPLGYAPRSLVRSPSAAALRKKYTRVLGFSKDQEEKKAAQLWLDANPTDFVLAPAPNPAYNPAREYTPRVQRPSEYTVCEWTGRAPLLVDRSVVPESYCVAGQDGIGTFSDASTRMYVIDVVRLDALPEGYVLDEWLDPYRDTHNVAIVAVGDF